MPTRCASAITSHFSGAKVHPLRRLVVRTHRDILQRLLALGIKTTPSAHITSYLVSADIDTSPNPNVPPWVTQDLERIALDPVERVITEPEKALFFSFLIVVSNCSLAWLFRDTCGGADRAGCPAHRTFLKVYPRLSTLCSQKYHNTVNVPKNSPEKEGSKRSEGPRKKPAVADQSGETLSLCEQGDRRNRRWR